MDDEELKIGDLVESEEFGIVRIDKIGPYHIIAHTEDKEHYYLIHKSRVKQVT